MSHREFTDQQRKFMYLPLAVFKNFTNIQEVFAENYRNARGKDPKQIEIKKAVEKIRNELPNPDSWTKWSLSKLDFIWPKHKKLYAKC